MQKAETRQLWRVLFEKGGNPTVMEGVVSVKPSPHSLAPSFTFRFLPFQFFTDALRFFFKYNKVSESNKTLRSFQIERFSKNRT